MPVIINTTIYMADYIAIMSELRKIKRLLQRGDQRELARRLVVRPNDVADAFDGFKRNVDFLTRLRNECQKLLAERESVPIR